MKMRTNFKKGLRWTWQREVLLKLIREMGGHVDADELYRRAREVHPSIGLATVYRNLKLFRDMGIIKELQLGEAHAHYELAREGEHLHFLCRRCGQLMEFESDAPRALREELEGRHGLKVEAMEIRLEGICRKCLEGSSDDPR